MTDAKVRARDHESYWVYSVLGFLIPLVGFIIGSIMLTKDDKPDRKLGEHTIVISVIGIAIYALIGMLVVLHSANSTPLMTP